MYVITSVGTIGCGKSTILRRLAKLTSWTYIESDVCKDRRQLIARAKSATSPVVILDRNNASEKERESLYKLLPPEWKFIVVDFVGVPREKIWPITVERVKQRGDNHPTIHYDTSRKLACMVMRTFIKKYTPVDRTKETRVEEVIQLKLTNTIEQNWHLLERQLHTSPLAALLPETDPAPCKPCIPQVTHNGETPPSG